MNKMIFKYLYLIAVVAFVVFSHPNRLFSEETALFKNTTEQSLSNIYESKGSEIPTLGELSIKMGFSLIVVLAIFGIILFVLKKYFPNTIPFKDQNLKLVRVVDKTMLSPKMSVYCLWAVDRVIVVGISNGNMQLLTEIKDQQMLEEKMPREFSDTLSRAKLKFSEIYNA